MNVLRVFFTVGQSVIVYFIVLGFLTVGYWVYEDVKNDF